MSESAEPAAALDNAAIENVMLEVDVLVDEVVSGLSGSRMFGETILPGIEQAARAAAAIGHCDRGSIAVRVTDDPTIHQINRQFLQHDYPTDVISFPYALEPPRVEGELIVSLQTAVSSAAAHALTPRAELLLYVVHGCLHLVGLDDQDDASRARMRAGEAVAMRRIGFDFAPVGG